MVFGLGVGVWDGFADGVAVTFGVTDGVTFTVGVITCEIIGVTDGRLVVSSPKVSDLIREGDGVVTALL